MFSYTLNVVKRYDWPMLAAAFLLVGLGLLSLLSTGGGDQSNLIKQMVWLALGSMALIGVSMIDYRMFRIYPLPILFLYMLGVVTLALLLIFGTYVRGSKGWIQAGIINIEPAEAIKPVLVILLAKYFAMRHVEIYRFRHIIASGFYVLLPSALVFMQPEFGSLVVFLGVWFGLMLFAGIKARHVLILALLSAVAGALMWGYLLQDYQKSRVVSFMNPAADARGHGYNTIQSITAVVSGGVLGKGMGGGTQVQLGFLPERQTDFVFAAISEEFGLAGVAVLLGLFAVFFWRIVHIAESAQNNFARFAAVGFAIMIAMQMFVNIAMNIGLFPVTGIPLPFISYGGSSLITIFLVLGFLQSIKMRS